MLDLLPFIILIAHFTDKWYLSRGRLWKVYFLTIFGSGTTITYNIMLWSEMNGNHRTILLFAFSSAWTIIMALSGIVRLLKIRRKENENK